MEDQVRRDQPASKAAVEGYEVLRLGAPWPAGDPASICSELTGVSVRVCRSETVRSPEGVPRRKSKSGMSALTQLDPMPCWALAQKGMPSSSGPHAAIYRYRCPKGVPCACVSVAHPAKLCRTHIWVRACCVPDGVCKLGSAGLPAGAPESAQRLADDDFEVAVDLLTVMSGSLRHVAGDDSDVRHTTKRLTEHQKWLVRHVCRAVHARCEDTHLRLGLFAVENAVSVAYLCTLFTQGVGVSFRSYLQAWRMYKVRAWLSEGRLSIKEIASRAGYSDPNRLRLAFKAATGLPPREWRERQLSEGVRILI